MTARLGPDNIEGKGYTYQNMPPGRNRGILCGDGDKHLWDVADFYDNLDARVGDEWEAVLRGLCRWSVSQVRAGELAALVEEHKGAIADLRGKIADERKAGAALEKRLASARKTYAAAYADDALDSERALADKLTQDITYRIDRVDVSCVQYEADIGKHQAFVEQLTGIIAELRAVERPALPDWLTQPGA